MISRHDFLELIGKLSKKNKRCTIVPLSWANLSEEDFSLLTNALDGHTYVEEIYLSNVNLTSKSLIKLCEILPSLSALQSIKISWNAFTQKTAILFAKSLRRCVHLEEIEIMSAVFKDRGAIELFHQMAGHPRIQALTLDNNLLTCSIIPHFINFVSKTPSFQYFSCKWNFIGPSAAEKLITFIKSQHQMEALLLSWNRLSGVQESKLAALFTLESKRQRRIDAIVGPKSRLKFWGTENSPLSINDQLESICSYLDNASLENFITALGPSSKNAALFFHNPQQNNRDKRVQKALLLSTFSFLLGKVLFAQQKR